MILITLNLIAWFIILIMAAIGIAFSIIWTKQASPAQKKRAEKPTTTIMIMYAGAAIVLLGILIP